MPEALLHRPSPPMAYRDSSMDCGGDSESERPYLVTLGGRLGVRGHDYRCENLARRGYPVVPRTGREPWRDAAAVLAAS